MTKKENPLHPARREERGSFVGVGKKYRGLAKYKRKPDPIRIKGGR